MYKKIAMLLAIAVAGVLVSGCASISKAPILGPITLDQKGPVTGVDNSVKCEKVGRATAKGILIFSLGDASIKAAMENGGIKKVHHVDSEHMNILMAYATYTTVVYGE